MPKRKSQKPGAVTILDVARHAGVSPMTASRVINGNPRVGQDLRERVQASVKLLGYRPNLAGRSLRTASSARIGVLYSNPSAAYLNDLMLGILEQSSLTGAQVLVERCGDIASQRAATQRLLEAGVDGILLPPPLCDSPQTLRELDEHGIPVVAVAGGAASGISSVRIDDYAGAGAMTRYLLDLGHARIGFIEGDPIHASAQMRRQAFLDTMAAAGIEVPPEHVVSGMFTYRSGLGAARRLLDLSLRPTAIFCSNDDMAAAALAVAHGAGIRVPDELTVVGFDDTSVATTLWPELTTIHQPVSAMGKHALALMLEEIRARRAGRKREPTQHVMKHALIERQSSARLGS